MVKYYIALILFNLLLTGCEDNTMKKYNWTPAVTTPKAFPAFLADATFTLADDTELRLFRTQADIRGEWGTSPYIDVVGERSKLLPKALDVTWLSFAEDQLYRAHCPLPLERIQQLFAEGFSKPWGGKKHTTYGGITIGVAPGGNLAVWLKGGKANVLVSDCKASKIDLPWDQVDRSKTISRQETLELAAQDYADDDAVPPFGTAVDYSRWDNYRKLYRYQLSLKNAPEGSFFTLHTWNAESYFFNVDKSPGQDREAHGVPSAFLIHMERDNYQYTSVLELDETEVFAAFKKLEELVGDEPVQLELEVSDNLLGAVVWLKAGKHVYMFQKTDVDAGRYPKK